MEWMISLAQLLLSLSFLVAVHEFGHLIAAKYFGMRVEQFSIGFPPKIWSFKKGETEYAISAIPLGGYVKISGMIDESLDTETMKQPPQPWEFRSKPAWQRLVVMLGGITVNVVVGVFIFIGLTFAFGDTYWLKDKINERGGILALPVAEGIGLQTGDKIVQINGKDFKYFQDIIRPEALLSTNAYYTVERDGKPVIINIPANFIQKFNKKETASNFIFYRFPSLVGKVQPGSTAEKAGMKVDDVVVEIDGKPISYHDEVTPTLRSFSGDTLSFAVERDGKRINFREKFKKGDPLGFTAKEAPDYMKDAEVSIKYGFFESIPLGTKKAFTTLKTQVTAFGKVISGVLSPKESLSGPIGIMQAFGEEWDWERFWQLTGVLSLVLAFMNLLPIPALDGGHVMFLTYEIVSRRKPSDKFLETAQKVGMVFLLALMVFIFANDIIKIFSPN
jgi:regulator of sigma E protease